VLLERTCEGWSATLDDAEGRSIVATMPDGHRSGPGRAG
jgi:hypothetical protein